MIDTKLNNIFVLNKSVCGVEMESTKGVIP